MAVPGFLLYSLMETSGHAIPGIGLGIITSLVLTWYAIGYLYEIEGWQRHVLTVTCPIIAVLAHPLAYWIKGLIQSA